VNLRPPGPRPATSWRGQRRRGLRRPHGDDALVNLWPGRVTFHAAYGPRLRYLEHDKQRTRSTSATAPNVIRYNLLPPLGTPPSRTISTEDVDAFKDDLLERVVRAQKILVILHGVTARARRKGWIATNPYEKPRR
jgi:hypothetical protein